MMYEHKRQGEQGIALPIVLIYGVILSSILIGTINALTSNNSNSRIRFSASSVNSALDSFVNEYRALLNDATYGNIFNQYWLVQGCSTSTSSTTFVLPVVELKQAATP